MDFSLSFGHTVFLWNCLVERGFSIDVLCPSLSLPGHVQKNMFRLLTTSLFDVQELQSLPLSSALFKEYTAAALSLERSC